MFTIGFLSNISNSCLKKNYVKLKLIKILAKCFEVRMYTYMKGHSCGKIVHRSSRGFILPQL